MRQVKAQLTAQRVAESDSWLAWAPQSVVSSLVAHATSREHPDRTLLDWAFDQLVKLLPSWVLQPEDLNTDGIDPNGRDFHIHDCVINNDDDSIAVKPSSGADPVSCSENMLIENMVLTGFGASIGSVPPRADVACVRNITFRNISMPGTGKGVYIKSNPSCGEDTDRFGKRVQKRSVIEGITYEDITMDQPFWWAIWIGPQQQHEPNSALGEKCALTYPVSGQCPTQGCATFANITLRNIVVKDPVLSPGVILGNSSNPMQNVVFDNVRFEFEHGGLRSRLPYGRHYMCENAGVTVVGQTSPSVECKSTLV
mmetsp:Transcript_94716/g.216661  ORF Transcript_94716/g.216661 Transcript_94716/m.216661 type:complete len:312 (-) Transcript_94716:85-1020(-)